MSKYWTFSGINMTQLRRTDKEMIGVPGSRTVFRVLRVACAHNSADCAVPSVQAASIVLQYFITAKRKKRPLKKAKRNNKQRYESFCVGIVNAPRLTFECTIVCIVPFPDSDRDFARRRILRRGRLSPKIPGKRRTSTRFLLHVSH